MTILRTIYNKKNQSIVFEESYSIVTNKNNDLGLRIFTPLLNNNNKFVIYFPGRWQNSKDWAFENPLDDIRYYLLAQGYNIITLDYRMNFQNIWKIDYGDFVYWKLEDLLEDKYYILNHLYKNYKIKKAYLMGFSMGAAQIFLLNQAKLKIKILGIVSLDGGIKQQNLFSHLEKNPILPNYSNSLIKNPAWDNFFRRKYIKVLHSNSRAIRNSTININQIRLLLIGEKWWPSNPINECKTISHSQIIPTSKLDRYISDITCPILCVMATNKKQMHLHRALCTAKMTSSVAISHICLDDWSHLDILSHKEAPEKIFAPVDKWLSEERDY